MTLVIARTRTIPTTNQHINGHSLTTIEGGWEIAQLVGAPVDKVIDPVTAITFSCAAIHFPGIYNLQLHQRPVPLISCLYGVGR